MPRTLSADTIIALSSGSVKFIVLAEILTPSLAIRMTSDTSDTVFVGNTYTTGKLGGISDVDESDPSETGIALTFSGVDIPTLAVAAAQDFINSPVKITLLVSGGGYTGSVVIFDGVASNAPSISYGNSSTVTVSCQGKFAALNRKRSERYADAEQQRKYPGDLGMQYAATVAAKEVIWPAASWFD